MQDMQHYGLDLFNKGYTIVPVEPKQKRVIIKDWALIQPESDKITQWISQKPNHGVGVLGRDTPIIDIDVTDKTIANKLHTLLKKILSPHLSTRIGLAPKLAVPCQLPAEFAPYKKRKSTIYVNEKGVYQAVEILGDGQMCVFIGIHPDTKKAYKWEPEAIPGVSDLPVLTPRIIDQIVTEFEVLADSMVAEGKWTLKNNTIRHDSLQNPTTQLKPRKEAKTKYTIKQVQEILDNIPEQDHDNWLAIGMALHHQFNGRDAGMKLWQYYSLKYGKQFDPTEIERRYPTFNRDSSAPGRTMGTILHMRNQAIAVHNMSFSTPDTTVRSKKGEPKYFYEDWYYVTGRHRFYNSISKESIKPEAFNYAFAGEMTSLGEKGSASNYVTKLNLIPKLYTIMYRPDMQAIGTFNDMTFVNSYTHFVPEGEQPSATELQTPQPIIDYFDRLIPDSTERAVILDFLSYVVQNPGHKINWAPVLLGIPGTGKTTILEIMRAVLGGSNVKAVSSQQFTSRFNTYAEGSMFNFIEEIRMSGQNRYHLLDVVKEVITNINISVTPKGVDPYAVQNVTSYMLCTNHGDALPIDQDDRRYTVIQTILNSSNKQFDEIYLWINTKAQHIKHWLTSRQLSPEFNPMGRAPKTASTLAMVQNTEDPVIARIHEMLADPTDFVKPEFISFTHLRARLIDIENINDNTFSGRLRAKLISMQYDRVGQLRINKQRVTLYKPSISLMQRLNIPKDAYNKALEIARDSADV